MRRGGLSLKKLISLFLAAVILMSSSLGCSLVVFAANSVSVDSFVESVEELNEEESETEKSFEESAGSRVIVKSITQPKTFGKSECIKGTYGKYIFQYETEEEANEAAKFYNSLSGVSYAVIDRVVTANEVPYGEAMLGTQRAKEYIANHEIPTDSVKVAVVDTGIDFEDEIFKDNPRIVDSGVNTTDSGTESSAFDDRGHGSMCSEIIMDNSVESVSIIGYKALNKNGSGTNLWVATAIEKAIEDEVDIINLSLGGESEPIGQESSIVLDDAVRLAISKGIIVVAASGNDGLDCCHFSPANVEGVITVGAVDKAGNRAYFSNYGADVDFVAPGVNIQRDYTMNLYATVNGVVTPIDDDMEPINGTSFSAPYIVAEIGTLISAEGKLTRDEVVGKLSSVSIPYEHLPYHDGFHAITENRGVTWQSTPSYLLPWCVDAESDSLYYGHGLPQIDLLFQFSETFERSEAPSFSVDSGHYIDEEFDLIISSPDAEIYYTQDESYPTKENGIRFDGSVHLDELQSFRAVAFSDDKAPSYFTAREYELEYNVPSSDFVMNGKYIMQYTGTRRNIIVPEKINNVMPTRCYIETHNTLLTSITLPSSCVELYSRPYEGEYCTKELIKVDGCGLKKVSLKKSKRFPLLVSLLAPKLEYLDSDCDFYELNLPSVTELYLTDAQCLYRFSSESLEGIKRWGFQRCYSLHDLYTPNLKGIGQYGLFHCYKLTNVSFENVSFVGDQALCNTRQIRKLYFPNLTTIETKECFVACGVDWFFAPNLSVLPYLIGTYNLGGYYTKMFLSSKFTECQLDAEGYSFTTTEPKEQFFYHFLVDIYGTPNTYAEEYANKFNLKFVPLPLLESEPDSMKAAESLSVDVLGFNLEYQWYGTNIADNRTGRAIEGANSETFSPNDFGSDYDFYYCVINSSDGDYHKTLITGDRKQFDQNGDGIIDIADISVLLYHYGESVEREIADVNDDGIVDVADLTVLLMANIYGTKE